jgi:hypothetical protein
MYVYIEKMISDGNESNTNRVFIEKDKYEKRNIDVEYKTPIKKVLKTIYLVFFKT